ncbi:MAG TPA: UDP-N-acetylglucosamine 2-epimerase (non-hydrolyzing) [Armatimonadota bacterium]|jgi:UDP-N-acetylglucosamine 2-epimerase (non-hydrolysing)
MVAMKPLRVALVMGTRPEVIKLGPLYQELVRHPQCTPLVIATAQHRQMLDQMMPLFGMRADVDLDIMQAGQTLNEVTCRALSGLQQAYADLAPDVVLVQGDTTTVLAGSLAAFYARIPLGHVEAGLRTADKFSPYPEEINRRLTGVLADWHFAATGRARDNLLAEGYAPETILVTGNTVIDALQFIAARPGGTGVSPVFPLARSTGATPVPPEHLSLEALLAEGRRLILVTAHRRENLGEPLQEICRALRRLAQDFADVQIVYAVHPNPQVQAVAREELAGVERVALIDPPDYPLFVALMSRAYLAITDSGGVQEEAPALNLPVLVARDTSERPEGLATGAARLVGTGEERIYQEAARLLTDPEEYRHMQQAPCPYGDGQASRRIVQFLEHHFGRAPEAPTEYVAPVIPAGD